MGIDEAYLKKIVYKIKIMKNKNYMNNKLLLAVGLFIIFVFVPVIRVDATQVYVGVQINRATAPGCVAGSGYECGDYYKTYSGYMPDNNWCLPAGTSNSPDTQMAIITHDTSCTNNYTSNASSPNTVCSYCSADPTSYYYNPNSNCLSATSPFVSATEPACPGGNSIWSGLLDLTNGASYNAYLYTSNFCPGYLNGYCYVTAASLPSTQQDDCCDICANYGLTAFGGENNCSSSSCSNNLYYDDANCTAEAILMGSACSSCTTGSSYSYFNPTTKACFTPYNSSYYSYSCSAVNPGYERVCQCNYPGGSAGFLLPFTASW